jgi:hypothetical protein
MWQASRLVFFKICEVGGLVIIHLKSTQPTKFSGCMLLEPSVEKMMTSGKKIFLHNVATWAPKKSICIMSTSLLSRGGYNVFGVQTKLEPNPSSLGTSNTLRIVKIGSEMRKLQPPK